MSYSASLCYGSTEIIRHCGLVGPDTRLSARLASQEDSAPVRAIIRDEATRQVFPRHCRTLGVVGSNPSCVLGPAERHGIPRPLPHRNPYLRSGLPAATPRLVVSRILATVIFAVDGEPPSFPATGRRARHRTGFYFQLAALTVPFVLSGSPARIVGHSNVSDPPIATVEGIPPHCTPFAGGSTTATTSAISRHWCRSRFCACAPERRQHSRQQRGVGASGGRGRHGTRRRGCCGKAHDRVLHW